MKWIPSLPSSEFVPVLVICGVLILISDLISAGRTLFTGLRFQENQ